MSDNDLTNIALGKALGVSHAQASRYRSGDRVPNDLTMLKIARLMDWPVEEQITLKYQQLKENHTSWRGEQGVYAVEFRRREPIALRRLEVPEQTSE